MVSTNGYVRKVPSRLELGSNSCHRVTQLSFQVDQWGNFGNAPPRINVQFKWACGARLVALDMTD